MARVPTFRLLVLSLSLLSFAVLVAPSLVPTPPAAADPAGISAAGVTGLQIANLDQSQAATMVIDFYKQSGGGPVSIALPMTGPGEIADVYLPSRFELSNGAYAAIIMSDRHIGAVARTEWPTSGGAVMHGDSVPGTDVLVPLAVKSYLGQTSLISIQNSDPSAQTTVDFSLYRSGESQPATTAQLPIQPGSSITLDLAMSPLFLTIPNGFVGTARVTSGTPVGVNSFIDVENSMQAVYAFEGVPAEAAAEKLYAPMIHAKLPIEPADPKSPTRTTFIAVMNPGARQVDVEATYFGYAGSCAGQTYTQQGSIAPGGNLLLDQGEDTPGASPVTLPTDCAASAVLATGGGRIAGIVVDRVGPTIQVIAQAGAYNAFTDSAGGLKTIVPLWRKNHVGLTTGLYAMNLGGSEANASVTFYDGSGGAIPCGQACRATIAPQRTLRWWPPDIAALKDGTYGRAVIESDQPLTVVVSDESQDGGLDLSAYGGLNADEPNWPGPGIPAPMVHLVPLVVIADGPPPPARTPTPTPTLTPAPAPELALPAAIPARAGGQVRVPVEFGANGYDIVGVAFSLDIDQSWVSFDPTDEDADGIPDGVQFHVTKLFETTFRYDAADTGAEIGVRIQPRGPGSLPLPDGKLVDFPLEVAAGIGHSAAVRFAAPPLFTTTDNDEIPGRAARDNTRIPEASLRWIYLPRCGQRK